MNMQINYYLGQRLGKNDTSVTVEGVTLTRESTAGSVYRYLIDEVLPRWDASGNEYSYRVRESELAGCVTTYLDRFGGARTDDATDEGVIVNTTSITTATCSLTIRKTVSGNMGDRQKSFAFTFVIDQEGSFAISGAGYGEDAVIANGGTFHLAHGQSVTISGIPTTAVIALTENCESYSASWSLGGVTQTDNVAESVSANVRRSTVTLTLSGVTLPDGDAPLALDVNNDLNIAINTGASLNVTPFAVMLLLLLAALWLSLKRRFQDD